MKRAASVGVRWVSLVWLSAMILAVSAPALAQDSASGASGKGPSAKKAEKAAGRLPAYYGKVKVTPDQREKILSIQKEYTAKIDSLRKQLDTLTKERDAKMEAVLTPEQQKQMAEMKAAAKKSRGSKKAAEDKPAGKSAEGKPAAKEKE